MPNKGFIKFQAKKSGSLNRFSITSLYASCINI
jgi:hypothetical protein